MQDRGALTREPLAQVRTFGTPWHGLVRNGVLTLPNNVTRLYPQPSAAKPEKAGMAYRFAIPGLPVVDTLPEEAAQGMEWRNTALLSGAAMAYAGQPLNGWVYMDTEGVRWRVSLTTTGDFAFTGPLFLQCALTRLGDIGGAPQSFTRSAGLTNWGQQGYDDHAVPTGDATGVSVPTSAGVEVHAVSPTGNRAALMVHVRRDTLQNPLVPYGWVELVLTGAGTGIAMSLQVLRNRDQTLRVDVVQQDNHTVASSHTLQGGVVELYNLQQFRRQALACVAAMYWDGGWQEVLLGRRFEVTKNSAETFVRVDDFNEWVEFGVSATTNLTGLCYVEVAGQRTEVPVTQVVTVQPGFLTRVRPFGLAREVVSQGQVVTQTVWGGTTTVTQADDYTFAMGFSVGGQRFAWIDFQVSVDGQAWQWRGAAARLSRWMHLRADPPFLQDSFVPDVVVLPLRYTDVAWGLLYFRRIQSTVVDSYRTPTVSPAGVTGAQELGLMNGNATNGTMPALPARRYTSWNPQTNQTAALDTVPVCWV